MMMTCTNCGQSNAKQSNFCRYCGMKFGHPPPRPPQRRPPAPMRPQPDMQREIPQQPQAPRPYSWKTDEFQVKGRRGSARETRQIENVPVAPAAADAQLTRPLVGGTGGQMSAGYRCPRCSSPAIPHSTRKISSAGWIVFAVLLVVFFPLFWIGFLIKEDVVVCPVCSFRIN